MGGVWGYLWLHKRFWLPVVVLTAIFGGLIVLSAGFGIVPFTYTRL
ncbi:MAG: hypothetical protein JO032_05225 [Alphaproteobacteria bacterium]|nr:hypothetical protein [Alphaproteobacteria bacterium]